ncbi:MarR family winged helix-turn-helix transcriptional regulator [Streptomyces sp. NBC_01190]|uniref:MarR family winged helix-turn-helix transcriptional regulator n=1 Tax=Streptomyces sp. NBC_01190 TaxID=2903767 RepID=UPI003867D2B9|nr:MarR family winged helix-turn-helix transcriptional regulator [Streptomyces sp. NBC_01190]
MFPVDPLSERSADGPPGPGPVTPPRAGQPLQPLSAGEEALVRALGRVLVALPRSMDDDMLREQGRPLSEYTALMLLSEAPGRSMRMSELAAASLLSLSGMTRVISRLESDGLVQRVRCDSDARGLNAVLTDAGLAKLAQMWPTHLASARRHILDRLGGVDLAELTLALERLAT